MQQNEVWKPISDFPYYDVSNLGRIRSRMRKNGYLKQSQTNRKYLKVTLSTGRGTQKTKSVHQLVAEAFLVTSSNSSDVNHKDGNKSNNHVENLEWMSHSANRNHAIQTGLCKESQGSKRRLSRDEAQRVWQLHSQGKKQREIAETLEVTPGAISHIISGRTWKHLKPKSK